MRYKYNKKLFKGEHQEIFKTYTNQLKRDLGQDVLYVASNIAGIICKKSADFLFGEKPIFSAGNSENSPEQAKLNEYVDNNHLHITNYESALSNAYRGDSFYKIMWRQEYGGELPQDIDPFRVFISAQNAEYVFPQTDPNDATRIIAYHIAYPQQIVGDNVPPQVPGSGYIPTNNTQALAQVPNVRHEWILNVESHYPGEIRYRKFKMDEVQYDANLGEVVTWRITEEIDAGKDPVITGVPFPLVVHVPNYATDDTWEGIDDLSEHYGLLEEINNRLTRIAAILDKHSDPAMAVPAGSLQEDENGNPVFYPGRDKMFEVMDKNDIIPQYITWDGQLQAAFEELKMVVDQLLMNAEIPPVALGRDNSGTSGASGLSIKFRMNSLLAKINRKRQYYEKGLKQVLFIAQLLEQARRKATRKPVDFTPTIPRIHFKDGLPRDDMELAQIASIRTGGKPTWSQKTAIMVLDDKTDAQAQQELDAIQQDEQATRRFRRSSGRKRSAV
ncbi:phage portal protein [Thermoactinomyces daqus]|uniref:Phage portal protein n=2 Tax=Thermoactinomyces daqus TaxID=1329516 RepID=A0A7W1X8F3_9BACL|nr:phage portal protein [Thermoactinomyces daqus]